jgi:hypothetical protein
MQPDVADQLAGVARILRELVAPEVADAYTADILRGAVTTLETLAAGVDAVAPFLRWDIEATGALLASVGIETPASPGDTEDPVVLAAWHREVRGVLESAIDTIRADPAASAAAAAHFRARAAHHPLATRPRPTSTA